MEFLLLSTDEKKKYGEVIFSLLAAADGDFVPPLSKRNVNPETNRNTFSESGEEKNLRDYCDAMLREEMLLVLDGDTVCGLVAFARNLENDIITESDRPNIYIGTAIISAHLRGKGTLTQAYEYLFDTVFPETSIFVRTWSSNLAHLKVLSKFRFEEIKRIKNHRGDGIDTIYFAKRR